VGSFELCWSRLFAASSSTLLERERPAKLQTLDLSAFGAHFCPPLVPGIMSKLIAAKAPLPLVDEFFGLPDNGKPSRPAEGDGTPTYEPIFKEETSDVHPPSKESEGAYHTDAGFTTTLPFGSCGDLPWDSACSTKLSAIEIGSSAGTGASIQ
jgi:hypothetical protein